MPLVSLAEANHHWRVERLIFQNPSAGSHLRHRIDAELLAVQARIVDAQAKAGRFLAIALS